jgi:ABC-type transport system involved in cytochrome bd biosynthesis fused ATPase/permease subunit
VLGHAAILAELGIDLDTGDAKLATERPVSGGERQWIALARAIATDLPVLLLDEPTSALDAEAQGRALAAIARLRGKRTVILVTHRREPLAIADVVVPLAGRDEADADPRLDPEPRRAEQLAVEDVRVRRGPLDADA